MVRGADFERHVRYRWRYSLLVLQRRADVAAGLQPRQSVYDLLSARFSRPVLQFLPRICYGERNKKTTLRDLTLDWGASDICTGFYQRLKCLERAANGGSFTFSHSVLFCQWPHSQIITETLFFFAVKQRPAILPDEIHVLTTTEGKALICDRLLTAHTGHFFRFCRDYRLDPQAIRFGEETVEVLRDAHGIPLADIRTDSDNNAAADHILTKIRSLTSDPQSRIYASMAGGRKTMDSTLASPCNSTDARRIN